MNISSPISFQAFKTDRIDVKKNTNNPEEVLDKFNEASGFVAPLLDDLDRRGIDIELTGALDKDFVCFNIKDKATDETEYNMSSMASANPIRSLSKAIAKAYDILLNKQ